MSTDTVVDTTTEEWAEPIDDQASALADTQPIATQPTSPPADDAPIPSAADTVAPSDEGGDEPRVEWPDELLQSSGLTAEQAARHFASPDQLEAAVKWHDQQMLQVGKQWLGKPDQQPPPPQQAVPPVPPPTPAQQDIQRQTQDLLAKLELGLKPEEWDEQTIGLVNRINDHYHDRYTQLAQRNAMLESSIQTVSQYLVTQAEREYVQQFDTLLNSLPDTYQEVFGKGSRADISPQSKEFGERVRLNQSMSAIARGRQMNGLPPLTTDQLFHRALRAEFGNIETKAIRQELGQKLENRQRQFTARPSGKHAKQLNPETKAASRVEEFMKSRGIPLSADSHDESDGV